MVSQTVAGKRILALGITGIAKSAALRRFSEHCRISGRDPAPTLVDFEGEFLFPDDAPRVKRTQFLAASVETQRDQWETGWRKLSETLADESADDILLSMHGCYIQAHYGSRWILDPNEVAKFRPDLIVTLIADVYDMWWRTEKRAVGEDWRGRPTLEQLVLGRRFEVAVGDQISLAAGCKHLVLAVEHPLDTLYRCAFRPNVKVAYLSFPISEPRRMQAAGDGSGIEQISEFIEYAHACQKQSPNLACVCPLGIDELPFVRAFEAEPEKTDGEFDRDRLRWNLSDFWPTEERMGQPADPHGHFPIKDAREAAGSINSDVTWRDFRLVEQAHCLAVFNPVFNNRDKVSGGVGDEIAFARHRDLPVYIYQDPHHDEAGVCRDQLNIDRNSSLAGSPDSKLLVMKDSLESHFDAITAS